MNAPDWLKETAFNHKDLAIFLGIRQDVFSRKLNGKPLARSKKPLCFTQEELEKIEEYRKILIQKLNEYS